MSLAYLLKKGSLRGFATATHATFATHDPFDVPTVATVATVAVATTQKQAANDPAQAVGLVASEPPDPNAWRELAAAYHVHHFKCTVCKAAGRGAVYGLRCGTGAALWINYQNT